VHVREIVVRRERVIDVELAEVDAQAIRDPFGRILELPELVAVPHPHGDVGMDAILASETRVVIVVARHVVVGAEEELSMEPLPARAEPDLA
jgi:hypothetical protein